VFVIMWFLARSCVRIVSKWDGLLNVCENSRRSFSEGDADGVRRNLRCAECDCR
jgi:hypothetical protein